MIVGDYVFCRFCGNSYPAGTYHQCLNATTDLQLIQFHNFSSISDRELLERIEKKLDELIALLREGKQ